MHTIYIINWFGFDIQTKLNEVYLGYEWSSYGCMSMWLYVEFYICIKYIKKIIILSIANLTFLKCFVFKTYRT